MTDDTRSCYTCADLYTCLRCADTCNRDADWATRSGWQPMTGDEVAPQYSLSTCPSVRVGAARAA